MLLMPYYGVKLSKSFVHKNNMLENKNLITLRSEGNDVFLFVIPAIGMMPLRLQDWETKLLTPAWLMSDLENWLI